MPKIRVPRKIIGSVGSNDILEEFQLYIAAFNFGTSSVQLHLADIPTLSARNRAYGYVVVRSSNLGDNTGPSTPVDVSSEILPMPPESGVVLKFKE